MGITIISLPDGRTQLLHTMSSAKTKDLGEEGVIFMQEMIEIARQAQLNAQQGGGGGSGGGSGVDSPPKQVRFMTRGGEVVVLQAGPAQFGPNLGGSGAAAGDDDVDKSAINGQIVMANDIKACSTSQQNGESMRGKLVLVERGDCMFIEKARVIQSRGAIAGIVMDTTEGSAAASSPLFAMSGDATQLGLIDRYRVIQGFWLF